jgi:hypothetical protein
MAYTFANAVFTTTISTNEIKIEPTGGSIMQNASAPRLGYTSAFGASAAWQNPIWFRFYEPIAVSEIPLGTLRTFQAIDVETKFGLHIVQSDVDAMLAILFANYYTDPTTRAALEAVDSTFTPIFQRLAGETPSTAWSTTFPTIGSSPNLKSVALFEDFGVGYTLADSLRTGDTLIGTVYKEVHVTDIDPLADAATNPAKYRYLSSTRQNPYVTAGNRTQGMIIYTNLWDDAFSASGMTHYAQFLAIVPVVAKILYVITASAGYNPVVYLNALLDSTMLQKGAGYYNRATRVDATKGWFGNNLFSFFNEVAGATLVAPFMGFSEYLAMKNMVYYQLPTSLPLANSVPCIWTGPNAAGNLTLNDGKSYVRVIMYYAALAQIYGSSAVTYVGQTQTNIQNSLGVSAATFYQAGANALSTGEYGHFFRFAQTVSYSTSNIFATFVQPYLSWQGTVSSLQLVALDKVSNTTQNTFLSPISNLSSYVSSLRYNSAMTPTEETNLTNYTYP